MNDSHVSQPKNPAAGGRFVLPLPRVSCAARPAQQGGRADRRDLRRALNMLRRLRKDYEADYSACVFDAKGKTFRDDWYPEYKAHRPPMPDDLRARSSRCTRRSAPRLAAADDRRRRGRRRDRHAGAAGRAAGMRSVISTGDKDMAQLVNAHVTLVNTMSNETLDEAGVDAKFGVPPERIVDYLALIGDAVDNVPGVAKVGPKTAVKWLTEYGSLDNRDGACRRDRRRGRREPARALRLPAAGARAGHRQVRCGTALRSRRPRAASHATPTRCGRCSTATNSAPGCANSTPAATAPSPTRTGTG